MKTIFNIAYCSLVTVAIIYIIVFALAVLHGDLGLYYNIVSILVLVASTGLVLSVFVNSEKKALGLAIFSLSVIIQSFYEIAIGAVTFLHVNSDYSSSKLVFYLVGLVLPALGLALSTLILYRRKKPSS